MKKLSVSPVFFLLVLLAAGMLPALASAGEPPGSLSPGFGVVDRYVKEEMQAARIPGLALAIVHGKQVVHLKGFGEADPSGRPITPQTPFNIGSTAKAFTALAIMQLEEAGRIELRAPVQVYLPWFHVADPDASSLITVLDLLNHTSGLPPAAGNDYSEKNDAGEAALEMRVRALRSSRLNRPAGTVFEYSNANYDVLGLIVQSVSGQSYERYIQDNIFAPLEMNHSYTSLTDAQEHGLAAGYRMWAGFPVLYEEAAPPSHRPSGHQFSTAEDLAHLVIAHMNGGRYGDQILLSREGILAMRNTPVPSGPNCAAYSMHWGRDSRCSLHRLRLGGDAASYKARILVSPEDEWGVIVLMNTQAIGINGPRLDGIADGVLSLLQGESPVQRPSHNIPVVAGFGLIAIVTLVLGLGIVSSSMTLLRDRSNYQPRPDRLPKSGWWAILSTAAGILWILLLAGITRFAAGTLSTRPLGFLLVNMPDLGWLIVVSGALSLLWTGCRALLAYRILRPREASQPSAGRPTPAGGGRSRHSPG